MPIKSVLPGTLLSISLNSPHFKEADGSLLCSYEPVTSPYAEPDRSNPPPPSLSPTPAAALVNKLWQPPITQLFVHENETLKAPHNIYIKCTVKAFLCWTWTPSDPHSTSFKTKCPLQHPAITSKQFHVRPAVHRWLQAHQTTTSSNVTLGYPGYEVTVVTSYPASINAFCFVPYLYQTGPMQPLCTSCRLVISQCRKTDNTSLTHSLYP